MAQRIFASNIRPLKIPQSGPILRTKNHKKEFLQFFGPETPNASRNRYWNQWLVRIRSRSGPGHPPIYLGSNARSARPCHRPRKIKTNANPAQKPREPTNDRNKTLKSRVCSKDVSWLGHMAQADRKTVSIDTRPTEPSLHLAFDGRSNRYRDAT